MSTSFLTQGHHVAYICLDVIFQILLLCSRPMMSHHVICHVTAMSHASSSLLKGKRKRNIKFRKIDKRKRKMLVSKAFYNTRKFDFSPILPRKLSWDFCKKRKCDSISAIWKINFKHQI